MKPIAVCSVVFDPFPGEEDPPFLTGFYDGKTKAMWWGDSCLARLADHIKKQTGSLIIYWRDGGRNDFYHMLPWIERTALTIVDSRVLKCYIGPHQLRDSWAILPFELHTEQRDWSVYHRDIRLSHRGKIESYLSRDLTEEYALCMRFIDEFGQHLTIGGVSARELARCVPFWRGGELYHSTWKNFYFGGRCEMFASGLVHGNIHAYDISSAFPAAMVEHKHPVGTSVRVGKQISDDTFFVSVKGQNYGAFCFRRENGNLSFSRPDGVFNVSLHEFEAAIETGAFRCDEILEAYSWERSTSFEAFVEPFYAKKRKCSEVGDRWGAEIYKHILNAAYGKFSQNPSRYSDYYLTRYGFRPPGKAVWVPGVTYERYVLWKKPASHPVWMNLATAASITGATRAKLLRGMMVTPRVLYVDTDSIISDGPSPLDTGEGLGQWKLEHKASMAAFVRKKTYGLFDQACCVKAAHSGCQLSGDEIIRAARGEKLVKTDTRPTFSLRGRAEFRKYTISKE